MANAPEVWLRGPIAEIPPLLQPVAHSLLQSREELHAALAGLSPADVWTTPGGAASVGFHARHAAGSLDRLFTYARGEQLNAAQKAALAAEGQPDLRPQVVAGLLAEFDGAVERALAQLRATDEATLTQGAVWAAGSCRARSSACCSTPPNTHSGTWGS